MKKTSVQVVILILIAVLVVCSLWLYDQNKPTPVQQMTVVEKKARFTELLVPAVDKVYTQLMSEYERIDVLVKNSTGDRVQVELADLKQKYRATTDDQLLRALKPHPKSIALAQAAMESNWATSRFFLAAKNVFGVWSFNEHEERIKALKKRGDKTIWVKKYPTVEASIRDYYLTVARGVAFSEFRKLKMETDDPFKLVEKLDRYSEKGAVYGRELAAIIRYNNFTDYDN